MEGRQLYARGAWAEAEDGFAREDAERPLGPGDLERWATVAYMLGRDETYLERLQRCHEMHVDAGDRRAAARSAFWIAITHVLARRMGPGGGWLATAERLLEDEGDCVERHYLKVPAVFRLEHQGDPAAAADLAGSVVAAARRFGDRDLAALCGHTQGHMLVLAGEVEAGLRLLDEAMVAAASGRLSPIPTGLVYCGSIIGCGAACDVGRARDWTELLSRWCDAQPEMVAFTGKCRLHRAELLLLRGEWDAALEEARRAAERQDRIGGATVAAAAAYVEAEVHRLRGESGAAETAYRAADLGGAETQPGLALLRAASGDRDGAVAMLARALETATGPHRRAPLLAAAADLHARRGDAAAASAASAELDTIGERLGTDLARAMAADARARVDMTAASLRRAGELWRELGATYECARLRELLGESYSATGDEEGATQEREAALDTYATLGAAPDVARVEALLGRRRLAGEHGLSPRELEVLLLVANGATNKAIAADLVLSERTVDRHVSNILAKLRVSSRSAATAYAYEHGLV